MPQIKHHLTDALLMAYAAGILPEAFNLVIATHVSLCDDCRAQLSAFDALGGEVLIDAAAEPMDAASLAATLALIANCGRDAAPPAPPVTRGLFPAPLRNLVGGDLDQVRWRRIGGGVSQAVLPSSASASARLLWIPAGAQVPDHGHAGLELTLVLQGAFHDEADRFGPGDIEVADETMIHQPVADAGQDCICLAATDAPLRFRALMPRLAQSFLRI